MNNEQTGWVSLWRELFEKPIWLNSTPEHKVILITLLMMANHKPNQWEWNGKKCTVNRGQFITSAKSIIEFSGAGITRQNVRGALARFEKLGFLTIESTKTGCKITICNYDRYQNPAGMTNQAINQEVTKDQPRGNQGPTTNNNDNNVISIAGAEKKSPPITDDGCPFTFIRPVPPPAPVVEVPKKKIKSKTPLAVAIFRGAAHCYPNKSWWGDVETVVGDGPAALELWSKIVKQWVGIGWNPMNVSGMLEFFQRGEIPQPGRQEPRHKKPAGAAILSS